MVKLDIEVTVPSGPCFFRKKLETSVRKKVDRRIEATVEERVRVASHRIVGHRS